MGVGAENVEEIKENKMFNRLKRWFNRQMVEKEIYSKAVQDYKNQVEYFSNGGKERRMGQRKVIDIDLMSLKNYMRQNATDFE